MSLAEELKMAKSFSSVQGEVSVALLVTAERLREYTNRACQKFDITIQQYNMLRILRGSHPRALSCTEINSRMIQRSPDITRLITRLEQGGYVVRSRDPRDNRIVRTAILPSGLQLIEAMHETITFIDTSFNVLSDEQCQTMLEDLEKVRHEINKRLSLLP